MKQEPQTLDETGTSAANDIRLVGEVLRKDRKATAEFVERYTDSVYSYVRRRVMPRAEAVEDLVQEVFVAAWSSLGNFRGEASLQHWLLGIARHKVEDYYRKRLRGLEVPEEIDEGRPELMVFPGYEEQLDRVSNMKRMYRVLAKLPEAYGLVLRWRYLDQRNTWEMAQLAGKTEKSIERLLARARTRFREEWSHADG